MPVKDTVKVGEDWQPLYVDQSRRSGEAGRTHRIGEPRGVHVFSDIVGHEPNSLPLNLWPDVFRPNVRTV